MVLLAVRTGNGVNTQQHARSKGRALTNGLAFPPSFLPTYLPTYGITTLDQGERSQKESDKISHSTLVAKSFGGPAKKQNYLPEGNALVILTSPTRNPPVYQLVVL